MPTHSYQAKIFMDADGSGSYTEITGVTEFVLPDLKVTDSPSDGLSDLAKVTIPGKIDLGTVMVTIRFDKVQFAAILALLRTAYFWKAQYPDASPITNGSTLSWPGYVNQVTPPTAQDDETLTWQFGVKPTALPAFVQAT